MDRGSTSTIDVRKLFQGSSSNYQSIKFYKKWQSDITENFTFHTVRVQQLHSRDQDLPVSTDIPTNILFAFSFGNCVFPHEPWNWTDNLFFPPFGLNDDATRELSLLSVILLHVHPVFFGNICLDRAKKICIALDSLFVPVWFPDQVTTLGSLFYPRLIPGPVHYPGVSLLPVWLPHQSTTLGSLFYPFDSQTSPLPWGLSFTCLIPGPGHYPGVSILPVRFLTRCCSVLPWSLYFTRLIPWPDHYPGVSILLFWFPDQATTLWSLFYPLDSQPGVAHFYPGVSILPVWFPD